MLGGEILGDLYIRLSNVRYAINGGYHAWIRNAGNE